MRMYDIIAKKRDGGTLNHEELSFAVNGYVAGDVPDYQMSALLMAIYLRGMTDEETAMLTDVMAHSGDMVDLSAIAGIKADKHSTGGVGDKTTLVIAPIVAACGVKIAKMSGRGLGHTGGTIDKMEAVPGTRTSLTQEEFFRQVNEIGISVIGQSGKIAVADKKMYALRDVTATVGCIPLIASSIMSKKLAAGSDAILLDVTMGDGAFMKDLDGALELARQMYDTTNGKLNVAMGSVLNIWHNYREAAESHQNEADNTLPTQEELEAAAQHCDINNVVIDEQAKTVYLADPEMSLDVGSVGKGYAVEMVCQAAQARGLTSALVSVGGNLRAIGKKPDGSQWTGGVENPWNASEVYTTDSLFGAAINMSDMALVTSGDYQRYFVVDGKRYHHLIDPDTLWPAAYFNSVTVLCPDSGMADCLTTGLFCMPLEEGQKLVESLDGVEAMWCTPDQQAVASSGWESHTRK